MPPGAAEFAVGDRLQADLFLLLDDALDLAVFDRSQFDCGDVALDALLARPLQRRRAQQAADMVGAERRLGAFHWPQTSSATSTIILSFAHCSSSARILPSSVEAKPHCGDRQSWSTGTYFAASSIRRLTASLASSFPIFDETSPSTSCFLPFGKKRSGSKPPARSVSYSRK